MFTITLDFPTVLLATAVLIPCGIALLGFVWTLLRYYPRGYEGWTFTDEEIDTDENFDLDFDTDDEVFHG